MKEIQEKINTIKHGIAATDERFQQASRLKEALTMDIEKKRKDLRELKIAAALEPSMEKNGILSLSKEIEAVQASYEEVDILLEALSRKKGTLKKDLSEAEDTLKRKKINLLISAAIEMRPQYNETIDRLVHLASRLSVARNEINKLNGVHDLKAELPVLMAFPLPLLKAPNTLVFGYQKLNLINGELESVFPFVMSRETQEALLDELLSE